MRLQYDFGDGPVIDGKKMVLFVAWLAWLGADRDRDRAPRPHSAERVRRAGSHFPGPGRRPDLSLNPLVELRLERRGPAPAVDHPLGARCRHPVSDLGRIQLVRHQRLRRRRLWRRQAVRLAVGHLLSHRGDPRLRGTRAGSLAAQCARPPDDFGRDRRALRGYLGPGDSRPLTTFAERSQLRELGAVRVLGPLLVDAGLHVVDGQADRELAPTTCCSLSGGSLMTTRSASENPLDTRNGAPFSTISMTHSPWSSTTKPFHRGDDHRAIPRRY